MINFFYLNFMTKKVLGQNILCNRKDSPPTNYVGRIRSHLNFEVVLEVKKAINATSLK